MCCLVLQGMPHSTSASSPLLCHAYFRCVARRYFTPEQAVEYGIIDKVMQPSDAVAVSC